MVVVVVVVVLEVLTVSLSPKLSVRSIDAECEDRPINSGSVQSSFFLCICIIVH